MGKGRKEIYGVMRIFYIVIGTVISPSIPLSGYTIFLDHLRNMYFIVHTLYLTKESLFSVYMINAYSNIHS